jgi:hypothetical protein
MTKNLSKELHDRFSFYLVRDTTNSEHEMFDRATSAIKTHPRNRVEQLSKSEAIPSEGVTKSISTPLNINQQ